MHEKFLLAALDQAKLGRGHCAPNPSVGAVAVQNGVIIARASHQGAGTPHAEQLLLTQITPNTPEVSLYITLEPCNHWGRTPPCVDAIIEFGIKKVIFAYLDPNPIVAKNNSTDKLKANGVEVLQVSLPEINEFYKSYAHWTSTGRPRVTVKMAHTLDGKIGNEDGERLILSNKLCAEFTHEQRALTDVILTSARTVGKDNPQLNVRIQDTVQKKPVAIIDRELKLDRNAQIFTSASQCIIYHDKQHQADYPNSSFYPMPLKNNLLDLKAIINHLGQLGFHDVWVEAGGAIFTALHQQQLVDRTFLYLVPTSLGSHGVLAYQTEGLFNCEHTVSWHAMGDNMIACLEWQGDLCLPD